MVDDGVGVLISAVSFNELVLYQRKLLPDNGVAVNWAVVEPKHKATLLTNGVGNLVNTVTEIKALSLSHPAAVI